jgi:hypothetical protein
VFAGPASAKRVIMTPTIPRSCPSAASWDGVVTCLARFGEVTLERKLAGARLVRLAGKDAGFRVPGLYLYVERGKRWVLGGMLDGRSDYELVRLERVRIGEHEGYRFDVGTFEETGVSLDGDTSVPAQSQQRYAVFCAGSSYRCTAVMTACDLFVAGKSYFAFRGTLKHEGDDVVVEGDRRNTGTACDQPARVTLGWLP